MLRKKKIQNLPMPKGPMDAIGEHQCEGGQATDWDLSRLDEDDAESDESDSSTLSTCAQPRSSRRGIRCDEPAKPAPPDKPAPGFRAQTAATAREERRIDPMLDNKAVTFEEMCEGHQDLELTREQQIAHWHNLKTPERYAEAQGAVAEEFRRLQSADAEDTESLPQPRPGETPMTEEEILNIQNTASEFMHAQNMASAGSPQTPHAPRPADMRQTWDTCNEGEMNRIMNTFVDEGNPSEEQLMLLENITAAVISERLPLPTAVQTAAQLRQQFLTQAQVMNDIAIERLEHAEEICGGFVLELRHAKKWLESTLQPWTRNAAQAELLCANVLQWVQNNDVQLNIRRSEKPVKEACKRVRDVFVTRIRANMADQKDRPGFIIQLKEAYDSCIKPVTLKEVTEDQWKEERKDNWARQRALLLLAYDKLDREAGQTGFVSNNRVANDRRGGVARPRRRRQSAGGLRVSGNENSEGTGNSLSLLA